MPSKPKTVILNERPEAARNGGLRAAEEVYRMGLIRAAAQSVKGIFADQWREYFYCDAMDADVLLTKGMKRIGRRSSNAKGSDNLISDGSVIAVNEGQCMIIVDQGRIAEVCDEAGEFVYDASSEPSVFCKDLGESVQRSFEVLGRRFSFGGDTGKDQRVYFVNLKEIPGNKYGTVNPIPYRIVDENIGLDLEISIRCHGEYSYRIADPVLFYTNVCGNAGDEYRRQELEGQMRSELLTALQTVFARIAQQGIRYYQLAAHTEEMAQELNRELSEKWVQTRGIEIVSFGISGVKAPEEDEEMIKQLQRSAVLRDPGMAAAALSGAQAEAMRAAASNTAGSMMAFAGMNLAAQAGGMDARSLYEMDRENRERRQEQAGSPSLDDAWDCVCGAKKNTGKFCGECGRKRPAAREEWICSCGMKNTGKFCSECGSPRPAAQSLRCARCGWEAEDGRQVPRFCPNCGAPFDEGRA